MEKVKLNQGQVELLGQMFWLLYVDLCKENKILEDPKAQRDLLGFIIMSSLDQQQNNEGAKEVLPILKAVLTELDL